MSVFFRSAARWLPGTLLIAGLSAFGTMAWHHGSLDPFAWWIGGPGGDPPNSQSADRYVEPELPAELADAQYEPGDEAEERRDTDIAATDEDETGEGDAVEPARATLRGPRQKGADGEDELWFREPPKSKPGSRSRAVPANFEQEESKPARGKSKGEQSPPAPIEGEAGAGRTGPLMPMKSIDALEAEGDLVTAQQELSRWYWQKPEIRDQILPRLARWGKALYFSPQPHFYEPYVVQQGDQLRVIGQQHKLSWEYLAKLNQTDAKKIRAGQKVKILPGPFSAHVSLSRYELVVHLGGSFVKSYRVGVGKDGSSPIGTFLVKNKMIDPTYYGPDGMIAHDDPQNPLGERWIDIGDGFGIHGTIEPSSIGKNESRGCIRLLNQDVEEVYDFLVVGSEVKIER